MRERPATGEVEASRSLVAACPANVGASRLGRCHALTTDVARVYVFSQKIHTSEHFPVGVW